MFGERHVDIQATDAKGVHRRTPWGAVGMRGPGQRLGRHAKGAALPVKLVVELGGRGAGGNHAVLHREHHLDEAGDAGRLECVADIGFHAPDRNPAAVWQVTTHQP